MSKIKNSCAGAGKTFNLAKDILQRHKEMVQDKTIFVLSFTNRSIATIQSRVNMLGSIDEKDIIYMTVHRFMLYEIIYPYSNFAICEKYNDVSYREISEPKFKNWVFKQERSYERIHVKNVYNTAKKILKIKDKDKFSTIIDLLTSKIDSVFIDESQDLDDDAFCVFQELMENGVSVDFIGDIKQAISNPGAFLKFINNNKDKMNYKSNSITRRLPIVLNELIRSVFNFDEETKTLSPRRGEIVFYILDDFCDEKFLDYFSEDFTIIAKQKIESFYNTKATKKEVLIRYVKDKICEYTNYDCESYLVYVESVVVEKIKSGKKPYKVLNDLLKRFNVGELPKNEKGKSPLYASQIAILNRIKDDYNTKGIPINSVIDFKGDEDDEIGLVMHSSFFDYFTKSKKINFNKECNQLYVALTRTKDKLMLIFPFKESRKIGLDLIRATMNKYGINEFILEVES